MSSRQPPPESPDVKKLEEKVRFLEGELRKKSKGRKAALSLPSWFHNLFEGVTILSIIGFAFWLGSFSNTIKQNSDKLDKMYSIVLESKDGLMSRTSAIETKLDVVDKKLDSIDGKIEIKKLLEENKSTLKRANHAMNRTP